MFCKKKVLAVYVIVVACFLPILLTGCPEGPEPVEPDAAQLEINDAPDPADMLPPEEPMDEPEIEEVDIEDPDRAPDTVLATVDGVDFVLQDIYDEFDAIPVQYHQQARYEQHRILENIIQQHLMIEKAREKEMDGTDTYSEMMEQFADSPAVEDMDEETFREIVLMETLLQDEVVAKADISDEDLRELFEQYRQMMPEEITFEQIKPQLEQTLIQEYVEDYIQGLMDAADIERDEEWIEEKEEEALEARPPMMMPEGEMTVPEDAHEQMPEPEEFPEE